MKMNLGVEPSLKGYVSVEKRNNHFESVIYNRKSGKGTWYMKVSTRTAARLVDLMPRQHVAIFETGTVLISSIIK